MIGKRFVIGIIGFFAVIVLLGIGAVAVLANLDLRPRIERFVSQTYDRQLTIAALRIGWGNPLSLEMQDLQLANAPWGSQPAMIRIGRLAAEVDLWPLLRGVVQYRKLAIADLRVVLERDADGTGNWRFSPTEKPPGRFALVPKNRRQFPTLLDFTLTGGLVTFQTSSGHRLRIDLGKVAIGSTGADQAATVEVDGGYNGTPLHFHADTQSFAVMRDGSVPFEEVFKLTTPSAVVDFKGTMMDPLNFDGVVGGLAINEQKLGELLKIFGAETKADFPLLISGSLQRSGDRWQLQDGTGKLATSPFTGTLALSEGARGQPDNARIVADFADLDLDQFFAAEGKAHAAKPGDGDTVSLRLDAKPGTNIAAQITAKAASYGRLHVATLAVDGSSGPGQIAVTQVSFAFAGGKVSASGTAHTVPQGSQVSARAALSGVDVGGIASLIGAGTDQLQGRLTGDATGEMAGETLQQAIKASHGHGVLVMSEGRVSRALLEKASTDLRALFRAGEGQAELTCALGIVDVDRGIATISPLRLRTAETSLTAGGTIDLPANRLDVTVRAESATQSFYALRIPLRVSGDLASPSILPALGSSAASADGAAANDALRGLPPDMQQLAGRNSCLR